MAHVLTQRRFVAYATVLRIAFVLLAAGLLTTFVPSSSRANDFVKLGSPFASPVNLRSIATVYDRIPSTYEAWAAGEEIGTNQGVLLYFNGTFWTNIPLEAGTPGLTGVSGLRFLTNQDACQNTYSSFQLWQWKTTAWAVGKSGTILKLDPYSKAWNAEKKVNVDLCVNGTNNGSLCDTTANKNACAAGGGTCQSGPSRSCTPTELKRPDVCAGGTLPGSNNGTLCPNGNSDCTGNATCTNVCANWTSIDFNAVAAAHTSKAIAVGRDPDSNPPDIRPLFTYKETLSTDNAASTCENKRLIQRTWEQTTDGDFAYDDDVRAAYYIDKDHGWLAGRDASGKGKLWKYSQKDGYTNETLNLGTAANGTTLTSVVATFNATPAAITPGQPLKSLVWLGGEGAPNKIIRYNEAGPAVSSSPTTAPVRALALTRRMGGRGINLVTNPGFEADRLDSNVPNHRPDGWEPSGSYLNALGNGAHTSFLDPGGSSGRAYVGEPWQSISGIKSEALGMGLFATRSGMAGTNFPVDYWGWSREDRGQIVTTFQDPDFITKILSNSGLTDKPFQTVTIDDVNVTLAPYEVGTVLYGLVKIPDNTAPKTYQLKIEQLGSQPGRVAFNIENDRNDRECESDGSPTGQLCPNGTECPAGQSCVDRTSFPSIVTQPNISNSTVSWRVGTCQNVGTYNGTPVQCFDDSECYWGTCSSDSTQLCQKDTECPRKCSNQPSLLCTGGPNDCQFCATDPSSQCSNQDDCPGLCTDGTTPCFDVGQCPPGQTTCSYPLAGSCQGNPGFCPVAPTCNMWDTSSGNLCGGPAGTPSSPGPVSTIVTFPAYGGIKLKECANGTNDGTSCTTAAQCTGGGTCQVRGSGWYPFAIQYYQPWTPRCSNDGLMPCAKDADCDGGFCQIGEWCSSSHQACSVASPCGAGEGVCGYTPNAPQSSFPRFCTNVGFIGQSCTGAAADCGGDPGSCLPLRYKGTCNGGTKHGQACRNMADCPGGTCRIETEPPSVLTFQYREQGTAAWIDIPNAAKDNLLSPTQSLPQSEVKQEIPLSLLPGTAYRVSGKYKLEFSDQFDQYSAADPRWNQRPHAGVMTRCKNSSLGTCGYEINLFQGDRSYGVGSGKCQLDSSISCQTNQECKPPNQATDNGICVGDWQNFSAVVTNQYYGSFGSDPGQSLEIVCFADVGAKITCDELSVTPENEAAVTAFDLIDVWAVGDQDGSGEAIVYRNTFDVSAGTVPSDSWQPQKPPVKARLTSITAADPYHFWAVGEAPLGGDATILRLSPGNVTGWAWVGTSTNQSDPIGWIDFNCGNQGTCASQPSSFGVNVNDSDTYGQCANNLAKACTTANEVADCGGVGQCVKGVISGSAWLGSQDSNETVDFGPCTSPTNGKCSIGSCTGDPTVACSDNRPCQRWCRNSADPSSSSNQPCSTTANCTTPGETCVNNTSSTCSFPSCALSRDCSGNNNQCKFDGSCNDTLGQCYENSARLCPNYIANLCNGVCSQNQGFRCINDSDCKIKCSSNPLACRSSGWLSFDKSVTGPPPDPAAAAKPYLAKLNLSTDAIEGWGRLQLGKCNGGGNNGLACFQDSDCGGGSCDYSNAPSKSLPGVTDPDAEAGWVKLRGGSTGPVNGSDRFVACKDCTANANPPNQQACKICTDSQPSSFPTCNDCSQCTAKWCSDKTTPCRTNNDCVGLGTGLCKTAGFCSGTTNRCFTDSDCPGVSCTTYGGTCSSCNQCSVYGVSIDSGGTKQFSGFAWSPDLGWIDFSTLRLGGQLFFQTKFGDIYSGQNVGSTLTGVPPGFPGGSTECNATYRIVATGTITNFCSSAPISGGVSAFLQPGAPLFPLPQAENRYRSQIGEIDLNGLTTKVSGNRNKFGDVVEELSGNRTLKEYFATRDPAADHDTPLLGKVYHVTGDLTVDENLTFDPPANANPPGVPQESGAGTFVVDGNLTINANLFYLPSPSVGIRELRQLPSLAFIVKGDITIDSSVSQLVGTYFTEKTVTVESAASGDNQLVVRGAMVAQQFDFKRKYIGSTGAIEPAEKVIYDGRLQANAPPGLAALAQGLPDVQEVVP